MHLRHRDFGNLEGLPLTPAGRVVGAGRRAGVILCVVAGAAVLAPAAPGATGFGRGDGEIGADFALARFDSNLTDATGDRYSLRAGRRLGPRLQWEGEITRITAREELLPGADLRVTLALAFASAIVNFQQGKNVTPYLLAGIGLATMKLEAVGLSSRDTGTAYQLAGGSRFFFGERSRVALRVELSLVANEAFEHTYVHATLGAGLTFSVGKGAP